MRMFNPDGSESEMCGNGVRCVAAYSYDRGLCHRTQMTIETGGGNQKRDAHAGRAGPHQYRAHRYGRAGALKGADIPSVFEGSPVLMRPLTALRAKPGR